ncbi:MAG: hypothetical protein ACLRWQ_13615 [Flavonifractor plautii]
MLLDGAVSTYGDCWYELEGRGAGDAVLYGLRGARSGRLVASRRRPMRGHADRLLTENASPNAASPRLPSRCWLRGALGEWTGRRPGCTTPSAVGDPDYRHPERGGKVICLRPPLGEAGGALRRASGEDGVLELTCGLTAAGELSVHGAGVGELVRVSSHRDRGLSAYPVSGGSQYALDPSDGTLGSLPLSEDVKLYERAGSSVVAEIALEDILTDAYPPPKSTFTPQTKTGRSASSCWTM